MELQLSPFINKEIHLSSEGAGVIMDHSLIMGWGAATMGSQKKLEGGAIFFYPISALLNFFLHFFNLPQA